MPLCCWDDCNADNADGACLFKIYIRFSAPARGFIHSWLWVRNNHLLKQTITAERAVMAEIMSSCGEGARALHWCLSGLWPAPSEKSDPVEHFLRNWDLCLFQMLLHVILFPWKLLDIVPLNFSCCGIAGSVLCGSCLLLQWDNISALFFDFSHFNSAYTLLPLSLKCCRPAHFPFGFVEPPVSGLVSLQGCCNILEAL